ncbi:MAG: hypothetical protein L0099_12900 [Acidobacteria bacterium]|nr:hypothetical protein [Acidobacteriota bacterium]
MELWDREYLDLEVPAFIEFRRGGKGEFQFGAVHGWTDYRLTERDTQEAVEFSWEGDSEGEPLSGRGWAVRTGSSLAGRLFIHNGDDSSFHASLTSRTQRRRPRQGGA